MGVKKTQRQFLVASCGDDQLQAFALNHVGSIQHAVSISEVDHLRDCSLLLAEITRADAVGPSSTAIG
jgi:hypothetical protein